MEEGKDDFTEETLFELSVNALTSKSHSGQPMKRWDVGPSLTMCVEKERVTYDLGCQIKNRMPI